ncbi:MAG: hypothetical protein K0Q48_2293 [Bacillota bacterium]|jgi:hypothetical protein|nr:hypothetical protein [Bacillota bacterium]
MKPDNKSEHCLYCGKSTLSRDYIINPGANHELPSCSGACFEKSQQFVSYDSHFRIWLYIALFVLVAANLLLLGYEVQTEWKYVPALGVSTAVFICPLVFTRYERYQRLGIYRTRIIIRTAAAVLTAFFAVLIIG